MRKKGTTMNITEKQQKKAAKEFAEYWKDKGYEKGQSQKFWIDLLQNVYGVENATLKIRYILIKAPGSLMAISRVQR